MPRITAGVGPDKPNSAADVTVVQTLLNAQARKYGYGAVAVTGRYESTTAAAVASFQRNALGIRTPDGLVEPDSITFRALDAGQVSLNAADAAQAGRQRERLSGKAWFDANQADYPNSSDVADLSPAFGAHVREFVAALQKGGAHVSVSSTLRNKNRAFIMHWAWKVAHGKVKPGKVPVNPEVDIEWDHGDDKASRKAAAEMVAAFHIKYAPSLTSNHIVGKAIDMDITWTGPITVKDHAGKDVKVDKPRTGAGNAALHKVGASYGVKKLSTDPPHWSIDGH